MPKFLEEKLKKEYPGEPSAPFKIMNAIGAMKGSRETKKGKSMEKKHEVASKMKAAFKHHGAQMDFINKHLK